MDDDEDDKNDEKEDSEEEKEEDKHKKRKKREIMTMRKRRWLWSKEMTAKIFKQYKVDVCII